MSDRYPGTTSPAIERRFKALREELRAYAARTASGAQQAAERRSIVVSEDLSQHIAAADPHPQYQTSAEVSAAISAATALLTLLGLADVDGTGIEDGDALIYQAGTFVPGATGRPGITYRTIPEGVTVEVLAGEQYLVAHELVVEGELVADDGEVVIL